MDDSDFNPLHGSDSQSAADREIEKIFPVETTVAVIKPETALENGGKLMLLNITLHAESVLDWASICVLDCEGNFLWHNVT